MVGIPLRGGTDLISLIGRKRRERRAQTQPDHPFSIEACEYLTDGAFALLRVSGSGDVVPVSLVTQGDGPQAFDPLPQPDAGASKGFWHIAFALPTEVIEPGARVWLHDGGLYLADLVIPTPAEPAGPAEPAAPAITPEAEAAAERLAAVEERIAADKAAAAARPDETADLGDDARARKLVEAWSDAASLREKLNDREEELAEALQELLEARKDVQPLRDRVDQLTADVEALREELELAHKHGREARLRATEKAAELDVVRAEVEKLQEELSAVRGEQDAPAVDPEPVDAVQAEPVEPVESEETPDKSRRRSIGRRTEDRAAKKLRAELETKLAESQQRVEQLEKEAEDFAARREDAVADSLRERIAELEQDVRQRASTNHDLRALLESERGIVASGRREVEDLKRQLTTVAPEQVAEPARPKPTPVVKPAASANGAGSPPWSALDDELLARIEKAKALTR